MKKSIYFALAIVALTSSCNKELVNDQTLNGTLKNVSLKANTPSPALDWSNASFFNNGPNDVVPAPWAGGASRSFPTDYLNDYKLEDGWEMYFNTFNSSVKVDAPYFVLYNRYRGTMRIYYYFLPKSGVETTQVTFQLDLKGTENKSNILSFDNQEAIDLADLPTTVSKVQQEKIFQSGSWYSEEFQLAYDPSLINKSYTSNQLRWNMFSASVDQVNLDGIQKGEINGTVQTPKPTTSLFGQLVSGAINVGSGGLGLYATGAKVLGNFFSKSFGPVKLENVKKGIDEAANKNLKTGGSSIFNAVSSLVTGGSGGGFSEQKVNLIMDTKMQLNGSISHDPNGLFSTTLFISGTQGLSGAPGNIPNYNGRLGIFNLSAKPKVVLRDVTPVVLPPDDIRLKYYQAEYFIDKESFQMVINPDIINTSLNGASIQNYRQEVVTDDLRSRASYDFDEYPMFEEYMGIDRKVVTGVGSLSFGFWTRSNRPIVVNNLQLGTFVRISFDVVPNNGKPKTTIVKTFAADLVNNF
ncbi:MAG: hypothetical protein WC589_14675 [Sphingobacterium sp.]|uniref:hypothetical protein n=1 Tax=Sphingobacterium sp. 18053 TaxID=2681401 RepID=UPI0013597B19|nr:hypothetical protein [Sphingobacterium sp. 18053]